MIGTRGATMTCKECISYKACKQFNLHIPEEFKGIENHCEEFKNKANFAELKNMKWRPHYYIFENTGEKMQEGWHCSACGKNSYSRKEICDGCNTTMWKVELQ